MQRHTILLIPFIALIACMTVAARLDAQSPSAEDKLLDVLKSNAPAEQKCNACRELRAVGTEKSVAALAALLTDADVSHSARIALEAMPYPAAGAALREAVGKAGGLTRSGIIDSLGERRDPEAVPLLAAALEDKDPQVVASATIALGKVGTSEAAKTLAAGRAKTQGDARLKIGCGLVLCADRLLQAGKGDEAAKIYTELSQPGEPRLVRAGALGGLMRTAPRAAQVVAESLAGNDSLVRAAAAGALRGLSVADLRSVASGMAKFPAQSQAAVLGAIRVRGDKSLGPIALEAAKSEDETVRIAAVRALDTLGDSAALPLLIELAAGKDKLGEAARQSLEAMCVTSADDQIVAAMRAEKDPARRAGWIALLAARRPSGAVATILSEAAHPEPLVRSRAMAELAKLAAVGDVPAMVAAVLKAEKGPERDGAERAVAIVCQQITDPEQRAVPLISILRTASAAERIEQLPLLGRLGGNAAKSMVQEALGSTNPQLYDAGVRAISNWPDASVADQLLALAEKAKAEEHRLCALRAFIRVAVLPGKASDADKLALLRRAVPLATRDEEKAYILVRASAVRTVETLRFVLPYLDQPALAQEACKAVVELAHHKELRNPNLKEFEPALKKVIEIGKDATVIERARRYLQGS